MRLVGNGSLQIAARLAPPILVDDIGERDPADRPEPPDRVADWQQGIRVDASRQAERGLRLLLELQIKCRQIRAEAERTCGQQHVLYCRID